MNTESIFEKIASCGEQSLTVKMAEDILRVAAEKLASPLMSSTKQMLNMLEHTNPNAAKTLRGRLGTVMSPVASAKAAVPSTGGAPTRALSGQERNALALESAKKRAAPKPSPVYSQRKQMFGA